MNRLGLCVRLRQEAGIAGSGPTSTTNQIGELERIVSWIDQAYEDIQDRRVDWNFLRDDFSFNCVIGTSVYAKSTVTNLANWKKDSLRCYLTTVNNEQWLRFIDWGEFRDAYLRGPNRTVTGRPIDFTVSPQKELVLWPIPDQTYTINGEFFRTAHVMATDTDNPLFDRFHMAIVFNALMRYGAYSSDPTTFARGQAEYNRLINKIEADQIERVQLGATLA